MILEIRKKIDKEAILATVERVRVESNLVIDLWKRSVSDKRRFIFNEILLICFYCDCCSYNVVRLLYIFILLFYEYFILYIFCNYCMLRVIIQQKNFIYL